MSGGQRTRAAVAVATTTPAPARLLVHLTEDELEQKIEAAVARALARSSPEPEYLSRHEMAARLGISLATLDRLCREGLPFVYVGDCRRFNVTWMLTLAQSH
jgi:hypothetical protein